MKLFTFILSAFVLTLTLTQCKKKERIDDTINPAAKNNHAFFSET